MRPGPRRVYTTQRITGRKHTGRKIRQQATPIRATSEGHEASRSIRGRLAADGRSPRLSPHIATRQRREAYS